MTTPAKPWTPALESELRHLILREYERQQQAMASCSGKPAFSSSQQARESMPRRAMHGRVTVYRCKSCEKWRVGSHLSPAARERRPRRDVGGDEEGVAA